MTDRAKQFHGLHRADRALVLANAWDAASARLIEARGAKAIATTSAGLAWSRGYPDGDAIPLRHLAAAVEDVVRVVSVPVTVDMEGGYSSDPAAVGENVAAVVGAGAVGINIEDGQGSVDLLCAKIDHAKKAAARSGVDVFVNARTDVLLRGLVPKERAVEEAILRARRYRDAGCDGFFVPLLAEPAAIRAVVGGTPLPVNVMVLPNLPPVAELAALGVRRVSAGAAISIAAYSVTARAATRLFEDGLYDAMFEASATSYGELNALLKRA
jgi:2-methylisocitrate lyase-like PEP mutase family enzyme